MDEQQANPPQTPRPRRLIQEEKIARLLAEFGTGPDEPDYWEHEGGLSEIPEGRLPPPDPIFTTELWVNARIKNPLPREEARWPFVPLASLGAYTQRQAKLFADFLVDFYATELAENDWTPDISVTIEKDWAFDSGPEVDWTNILLAFGRIRKILDTVLDLPEIQDIAEVIRRDPELQQAVRTADRLKALAQDRIVLDPEYGFEGEVDALWVAQHNPALPSTLLSLQRDPWVSAVEITRHYGGVEEGGWWFNHEEPIGVMLTRYEESADAVEQMFRSTYEDFVEEGDIYSALGGAEFAVYRSQLPPRRVRQAPRYE